jgi:hypothetical protein
VEETKADEEVPSWRKAGSFRNKERGGWLFFFFSFKKVEELKVDFVLLLINAFLVHEAASGL